MDGGWENTSVLAYSASVRFLNGIRPLFYVVPPSKSSFETVKEVPNYVQTVSLVICMALETSESSGCI